VQPNGIGVAEAQPVQPMTRVGLPVAASKVRPISVPEREDKEVMQKSNCLKDTRLALAIESDHARKWREVQFEFAETLEQRQFELLDKQSAPPLPLFRRYPGIKQSFLVAAGRIQRRKGVG
jgi:hypothetical protein